MERVISAFSMVGFIGARDDFSMSLFSVRLARAIFLLSKNIKTRLKQSLNSLLRVLSFLFVSIEKHTCLCVDSETFSISVNCLFLVFTEIIPIDYKFKVVI